MTTRLRACSQSPGHENASPHVAACLRHAGPAVSIDPAQIAEAARYGLHLDWERRDIEIGQISAQYVDHREL